MSELSGVGTTETLEVGVLEVDVLEVDVLEVVTFEAVALEGVVEANPRRGVVVTGIATRGTAEDRVLGGRVLDVAPAVAKRGERVTPVMRLCAAFFSSQRCHATKTIEALKIEEYKPDAIPISIANTKL